MRAALEKTLRSKLEATVQKARDIVETAVREVLDRLGVAENSAPSYLTDDERKLRNRLRAHGRQLGDVLADNGSQSTELLVNEMAYEHWHRMLFARFLEQNHLLMYDPQTPVTLDECAELAADEGFSDGWQLAAKLAEKMLPQIFKTGSPVFDIQLPINHIRALEQLISQLHPDTFQASDSLGWCYQFWQSKRKDEVNASGVLIGAQELSPVTQLFTEPYMVSFLLDNALGAWWAKRRLTADDLSQAPNEQHLRELASIDGVPLSYLRFVQVKEESGEEGQQSWQPAAGWFDAWPTELKALKTLDPCCGSGHFLVALFLMLVPMRMQLEGLNAKDAVDAVLRDNLHGLELDLRCVDIAAFAVALEAWRYPNAGGYRALPPLQIACSGLDVTAATKNWQKIANGNPELTAAMQWFSRTFKDAPVLGSLIDPNTSYFEGKNEGKPAPWQLLLNAQQQTNDEEAFEAQVTAQGLALAAKLLADSYHFVATNVPYLVRAKQCSLLKNHLDKHFNLGKQDLATAFVQRILQSLKSEGVVSVVTPQNWSSQYRYLDFRANLIQCHSFLVAVQLGPKAFQEITGEVVKPLLTVMSKQQIRSECSPFFALDAAEIKEYSNKLVSLEKGQLIPLKQIEISNNPDGRLVFGTLTDGILLDKYANAWQGIATSDFPRFGRAIFEVPFGVKGWVYQQSTSTLPTFYSGMNTLLFWEDGFGAITTVCQKGAAFRGATTWGKTGIAIAQMSSLNCSLYLGDKFDNNTAILAPFKSEDLAAVWCFCKSSQFIENVRKIEKKVSVTNSTLSKVPFDIEYWSKVAEKNLPNGIPKAYTSDANEWIFHGHPCGSVIWDETTKWTSIAPRRIDDTVLQVAIARLLGYQWPAELDPEMELADEMRYWLAQNSAFTPLVDDDGIVCIPSVRGEKPAADRLEAILQLAYAEDWSANTLQQLLVAVGSSNLQQYLRDKFFEQHCKIFQQRPFIWQIWDGLKDGFSALVNYHKLDNKGLERLIYTYLGDWIRTQEHGVKEGVDGADIRLTAAKNLETGLKAILEGEKGLDIFVRWKPLHEQPIGWQPDLNDGVRLNIRPFMKVTDVGKKGAGVLRIAPKIDWKKDRGTDVPSAPWYHLGPHYGEQEGSRINDHHLTLAEKQAARAAFTNKEVAND